MGTFWAYGWWCFPPLLLFGVLAVACMSFLGARRGGGCNCAMRGSGREPPQTPRRPGA